MRTAIVAGGWLAILIHPGRSPLTPLNKGGTIDPMNKKAMVPLASPLIRGTGGGSPLLLNKGGTIDPMNKKAMVPLASPFRAGDGRGIPTGLGGFIQNPRSIDSALI
ncbi:hypothetical protein BJP34_04770 [Moorena producens PAL-8-15-08-1]|uniref:Uncharacterized protein n=1 Tax=Moorena producens PAL-8-15-08-1 TaxID=1458985 RepID=A0A1D8TN74_9CYAN|nr:hypothetical protein BJP34_04770 [Moorena producens PAL-8-15-08-1]